MTLTFMLPLSTVKPVFEEAAQRLASLGFPRMHSNVIIVDLSKDINPITGGAFGGYAVNKGHGFAVDRGNINVNVIIHEHAHMFWYNLPKERQKFFQKYYREIVSDEAVSPQEKYQHAGISFEEGKLDEAIETSWHTFEEEFSRVIGHNIESYFNVSNAISEDDESKKIESTVLTRFGESCQVRAKVQIEMRRGVSGYENKVIGVGDSLDVQKYTDFLLVQNNGPLFWEHPKPIKHQQLHEFVEFDLELLTPHQQAKHAKLLKVVSNNKPSRFFAPHDKQEEINKAFKEAADTVATHFHLGDSPGSHSTSFSAEQLFPSTNFYSTWMSRIGRRFKSGKITDMEGIKQAYRDAMRSQVKGDFKKQAPANINPYELRKRGYDALDLGKPLGKDYRALMHQKGLVASAYGAANIDELWATAVEHGAMGNLSPKLKKLITATLTGYTM